MRILIQGFDHHKFTAEIFNFFYFFDQKLQFTYPKASKKDVQAIGEVFIPHKRAFFSRKIKKIQKNGRGE